MKTLDEVIKAFECCENGEPYSNCKECSYIGIGSCCLERENDALLYLKMYRSDKLQWEADRKMWAKKGPEIEKKQDKLIKAAKGFQKAKAEMEKISADYVALKQWLAEQQKNPPLTWEQLKQMEGKPIWIELMNHDMWDDPSKRVDSEWWVIGEVRKDDIILATYLDEMELCEEDIGVIWQAYRKERK